MRKRITTTLVAFIGLLLGATPSVDGATMYGVKVAGMPLTSDNYQSITRNVEEGTVTFDPQTAALTGYRFGYELLMLNGTLTFLALWLISERKKQAAILQKQPRRENCSRRTSS